MSAAEFDFVLDGEPRKLSLELKEGVLALSEAGQVFEAEVRRAGANELLFRAGGRTVRVCLCREAGRSLVAVDGRTYVVSEARQEAGRRVDADDRTAAGGLRVKAPMPGKVIKLAVAEGEEVRKNQTLVIVEAMKMENEIKSSVDGRVGKVHVTVGELVDADRTLVEIEKR